MALRRGIKPYKEKGRPLVGVFFNNVRPWVDSTRPGKDHHLVLRYTIGGKTFTETWGWESGAGSALVAASRIRNFRQNHKAGVGPVSLAEERMLQKTEAERARLLAEVEEEKRRAKEITFSTYWENHYFPECESRKKRSSSQTERYLYDGWINPALGHLRMQDLRPLHLRKLRENMHKGGKAPATIKYAYAVFQQVWNMARSDGYVQGDSPSKDPTARLGKFDNKKVRYLSPAEVESLLVKLREIAPGVADMAMLSLQCGLRAGEIFKLTWADMDLEQSTLRLWDTKSSESSTVPLTAVARDMLARRAKAADEARRRAEKRGVVRPTSPLVFPGRGGKTIVSVSHSFDRAVNALGLNDGISDRRQRLTFHSLRHTCASMLVKAGISLYTVSKILRHSTMRMTERYAHLAQEDLRHALNHLDALAGNNCSDIKSSRQNS